MAKRHVGVAVSLALIAMAGCSGPARNTPAPNEPVEPTPPVSDPDPVSEADAWTCYETPDEAGMGSMCYPTAARCEAARTEEGSPDASSCSPAGVLSCFIADILYQDGSVAVTATSYCFLAADECEVFREIALEDPESARIGECVQMTPP